MTKEEISKFALTPTFTNNRTEIIFKNGTSVLGFFENNQIGSENYQNNKWNFNITGVHENHGLNEFDGNDFEKISTNEI